MHILPDKVKNEIDKVSEIAGFLWERQWAERNAGNISINLSSFFENNISDKPNKLIKYNFPKDAGGMLLFVTGKGSRLRHLVDRIKETSCIIKINDEANAYSIIWGGEKDGFEVTSEIITHVLIHVFNLENNPQNKIVLHTHPTELIVLSHHPIFKDQDKFNHSLWKMCPEIKLFVPQGVYCAQYALSGTQALAEITIEGLKTTNIVLWEMHGALATAENAEMAFDLLDVANKGAKLILTAWSSGFDPAGLSMEQLEELGSII
ncbi:MAG: rhamnulose-1-phosphate aldolase [Marinilabiliales bacterium]|nr:MAG: rhamnulose-1-phosphate aldolase [Marinilabiliales bacterium]